MKAPVHWVVGSGGLLGSAVVRAIARRGETLFPAGRVRWGTADAAADLSAGIERFAHAAAHGWRIHWCAGAGVTGSQQEDLQREVELFRGFLSGLARALPPGAPGALFVASSVGAVYGGASAPPFTEDTAIRPLGHYGAAKVKMEEIARAWSADSGLPVGIGRISNVYGPGQRLDKAQGLISRLCLSAITRAPLQVFVPLDTRRDYIYVDDCANLVLAFSDRVADAGGATTKILAAGQALSVGALIGDLRRMSATPPPVVMSSSALSLLQAPDLRVRSTVWTDLDRSPRVTLAEGMGRTLAALRSAHGQGAFA